MAKPKDQLKPVTPEQRALLEKNADLPSDPVVNPATETVSKPEPMPAEVGETAEAIEEKPRHDPSRVRSIAAFFYVPEAEVISWLDQGCPAGQMDTVAMWRKDNLPMPGVQMLTLEVPVIEKLIGGDYQSKKRASIDVSIDNNQYRALRYLMDGLQSVQAIGPGSPRTSKFRASRAGSQGDAVRFLLDQIYLQYVKPMDVSVA